MHSDGDTEGVGSSTPVTSSGRYLFLSIVTRLLCIFLKKVKEASLSPAT